MSAGGGDITIDGGEGEEIPISDLEGDDGAQQFPDEQPPEFQTGTRSGSIEAASPGEESPPAAEIGDFQPAGTAPAPSGLDVMGQDSEPSGGPSGGGPSTEQPTTDVRNQQIGAAGAAGPGGGAGPDLTAEQQQAVEQARADVVADLVGRHELIDRADVSTEVRRRPGGGLLVTGSVDQSTLALLGGVGFDPGADLVPIRPGPSRSGGEDAGVQGGGASALGDPGADLRAALGLEEDTPSPDERGESGRTPGTTFTGTGFAGSYSPEQQQELAERFADQTGFIPGEEFSVTPFGQVEFTQQGRIEAAARDPPDSLISGLEVGGVDVASELARAAAQGAEDPGRGTTLAEDPVAAILSELAITEGEAREAAREGSAGLPGEDLIETYTAPPGIGTVGVDLTNPAGIAQGLLVLGDEFAEANAEIDQAIQLQSTPAERVEAAESTEARGEAIAEFGEESAEFLVEDPVSAAGILVGELAIGAAGGLAIEGAGARLANVRAARRAGGTVDDVTVTRGATGKPFRDFDDPVEEFVRRSEQTEAGAAGDLPDVEGTTVYHAGTDLLDVDRVLTREEAPAGKPRPGDPEGMFVAPEVREQFLRIGSERGGGFSLRLPRFRQPTPTVLRMGRDVEQAPAGIGTVAEMEAFLQASLGERAAFIRSPQRITPEAEAVIPANTQFADVGELGVMRVGGRNVLVRTVDEVVDDDLVRAARDADVDIADDLARGGADDVIDADELARLYTANRRAFADGTPFAPAPTGTSRVGGSDAIASYVASGLTGPGTAAGGTSGAGGPTRGVSPGGTGTSPLGPLGTSVLVPPGRPVLPGPGSSVPPPGRDPFIFGGSGLTPPTGPGGPGVPTGGRPRRPRRPDEEPGPSSMLGEFDIEFANPIQSAEQFLLAGGFSFDLDL